MSWQGDLVSLAGKTNTREIKDWFLSSQVNNDFIKQSKRIMEVRTIREEYRELAFTWMNFLELQNITGDYYSFLLNDIITKAGQKKTATEISFIVFSNICKHLRTEMTNTWIEEHMPIFYSDLSNFSKNGIIGIGKLKIKSFLFPVIDTDNKLMLYRNFFSSFLERVPNQGTLLDLLASLKNSRQSHDEIIKKNLTASDSTLSVLKEAAAYDLETQEEEVLMRLMSSIVSFSSSTIDGDTFVVPLNELNGSITRKIGLLDIRLYLMSYIREYPFRSIMINRQLKEWPIELWEKVVTIIYLLIEREDPTKPADPRISNIDKDLFNEDDPFEIQSIRLLYDVINYLYQSKKILNENNSEIPIGKLYDTLDLFRFNKKRIFYSHTFRSDYTPRTFITEDIKVQIDTYSEENNVGFSEFINIMNQQLIDDLPMLKKILNVFYQGIFPEFATKKDELEDAFEKLITQFGGSFTKGGKLTDDMNKLTCPSRPIEPLLNIDPSIQYLLPVFERIKPSTDPATNFEAAVRGIANETRFNVVKGTQNIETKYTTMATRSPYTTNGGAYIKTSIESYEKEYSQYLIDLKIYETCKKDRDEQKEKLQKIIDAILGETSKAIKDLNIKKLVESVKDKKLKAEQKKQKAIKDAWIDSLNKSLSIFFPAEAQTQEEERTNLLGAYIRLTEEIVDTDDGSGKPPDPTNLLDLNNINSRLQELMRKSYKRRLDFINSPVNKSNTVMFKEIFNTLQDFVYSYTRDVNLKDYLDITNDRTDLFKKDTEFNDEYEKLKTMVIDYKTKPDPDPIYDDYDTPLLYSYQKTIDLQIEQINRTLGKANSPLDEFNKKLLNEDLERLHKSIEGLLRQCIQKISIYKKDIPELGIIIGEFATCAMKASFTPISTIPEASTMVNDYSAIAACIVSKKTRGFTVIRGDMERIAMKKRNDYKYCAWSYHSNAVAEERNLEATLLGYVAASTNPSENVVAAHTGDVTTLVRRMISARRTYYFFLLGHIAIRIEKKFTGYMFSGQATPVPAPVPVPGTPAATAVALFTPSLDAINKDLKALLQLAPTSVPTFPSLVATMNAFKTQERVIEKAVDTLIDKLMEESVLPYPRGLLFDAFLPDGSVQWYDMRHPKNKYRCDINVYTNGTTRYVEV